MARVLCVCMETLSKNLHSMLGGRQGSIIHLPPVFSQRLPPSTTTAAAAAASLCHKVNGSSAEKRYQESCRWSHSTNTSPQEVISSTNQSTEAVKQEINKKVNTDPGRLFAIVHISGLQQKITTEDIIIVQGFFPPNVGDRIRLEKVLAVGSKDFTLIGRPLLSRNLVQIDATVVEKTLSHTRVRFWYIRRKNYKKFKLFRTCYTMLIINSIEVNQLR